MERIGGTGTFGSGRSTWLALRRLAAPDRSWMLDEGKFWGLAFSRDGKRLAYAAHQSGTCEIRLATIDGRETRIAVTTLPDEIVSEMHGFSANDSHVVYSLARSGSEPELWAADLRARDVFEGTRRLARGYFFAGWADASDAIYAWERASGGRRVFRLGLDGAIAEVHSLRMDRTVALAPDGSHLFYSEKVSQNADDRRFVIHRAELDGTKKETIAEVATGCHARRLALALSPDGAFLHASAIGTSDSDAGQLQAFDLVLATNGMLRRSLAVKGWAHGGRAIVAGEGRSLLLANLRSGAVTPFVDLPVDHFAVSRDGRRAAWASGNRLLVGAIP